MNACFVTASNVLQGLIQGSEDEELFSAQGRHINWTTKQLVLQERAARWWRHDKSSLSNGATE